MSTAAAEDQKMPTRKKAKTENSTSASSLNLIDVAAVKEKWSRGREDRFPIKKVELPSGSDHPVLSGGDFVLNEAGFAATISFCFEYRGQAYGLTVGHLAEIGESVFCFSDDTKPVHPLPEGFDEEPGETCFMFELGQVVSKSFATDSLVFTITNTFVGIAGFKTLSHKSGLRGQLNLPDPAQDPPPLVVGTDLVGFGAQRRGAHGVVRCPSETENKQHSRIGNISFVHSDGDDKKSTDPGDGGTIFLGLDGIPFYFHHCMSMQPPFISYGFPLSQVMASHTQLGGSSESSQQRQLVSPDCVLRGLQERGLAKFNTEIIMPPSGGHGQENALSQPQVKVHIAHALRGSEQKNN